MPQLRHHPLNILLCFVWATLFLTITTDLAEASIASPPERASIKSRLSFLAPAALFPPSAIISLTDDNSTFFLARPAAFGPHIPENHPSAPLWIGTGFGHDDIDVGELGCGDVPGWHDDSNSLIRYQTTSIDSLSGKVALLRRGGCAFLAKVSWAQSRGAIAVIVGDDIRGGALIRMYAKDDTSNVTIPSVFTSHTTAQLLSQLASSHGSFQPSSSAPQDEAEDASEHKTLGDTRSGSATTSFIKDQRASSTSSIKGTAMGHPDSSDHARLWVTLALTDRPTSPFLDTLLVLVVSPLLTLSIVYAILLVRSRIQRQRWRAPKSVVERLPVRTYQTMSPTSSVSTLESTSDTTPLLQSSSPQQASSAPQPCLDAEELDPASASSGSRSSRTAEEEKHESRLDKWRRKYRRRQKECCVCLEEYEDGVSQVMSLPCGHEFHADCITPWLVTRRRTCPICKGDVVRSLSQYPEDAPSTSSMRMPRSLGEEEDIQAQAAQTRNDSPSASRPVPISTSAPGTPSADEDDSRDESRIAAAVRRFFGGSRHSARYQRAAQTDEESRDE